MKTILALAAFALLSACDPTGTASDADKQKTAEKEKCQIENSTMKAQADAALKMNERIQTVQLEVVKMCVAAHGIPVFVNNNVDCKKEPR